MTAQHESAPTTLQSPALPLPAPELPAGTEPSVPPPSRVTTGLTRPFWDALAAGVFQIQRCTECGRHQYYPGPICRSCWSGDVTWTEPTGAGTVRSYTVAHVPSHAHWRSATPYVIALVELDEGPCLTTNIVGCPPERVHVGQSVAAVITRDAAGQPLVQFTPRGVSP